MFSCQVDESTDVTSCAQFLVFVGYIHSGDIEAELLFCEKLQQKVQVFRRSKPFVILQSCSGNMFVGFVLMELLQ